jgi:serine/threonine protein kinase
MAAEQTLHRYDLLRRIAAGGMAEVFLAKASGAHGFEKLLAVKRILPALAADEEFVKRFIEEAKLAVGLSHANIVQVFDFGRFAGSLYIAMEFVDGADLATLLRAADKAGREVPTGTGLYVAIEIAKALDYAHRKPDANGRVGIVHRDVSPSNVLVSYEGEVKLADFGIATAAAAAATERRRIMGKWRYMSPEQTEAKPLTPSSDIFSAGALFYELLTGKRLFPGDEIPEIVKNVRELPIAPPSAVRSGLPDEIDTILLRALERDPARRYPSMKEMLAALLDVTYSRTIRASQLDAAQLVGELVVRKPLEPPPRDKGPRPLDDILRSELGLDGTGNSRLTVAPEPIPGGPSTLVRRENGKDGLSVWELEHGPTVSARAIRSYGLGALIAVIGLVGAGFAVMVRRGNTHDTVTPSPNTPQVYTLEVDSRPPGAEVTIDGKVRVARTPGIVPGLSRGRHRIAIRLPGHEPFEESVDIYGNTVLDPYLRPLDSQLAIEVDPAGAELFIDGNDVGTAPHTQAVPPGQHTVRAQKKGFGMAQQTVQVGPEGAKVKLHLTAETRWGTLDVFSEPWGEIYVDGKDTGKQTPQRGMRVPAGHHKIRLVNPVLHAQREVDVDVGVDERKLVREQLTK